MENYETLELREIRELIRKQEITGPSAGMPKGSTHISVFIENRLNIS